MQTNLQLYASVEFRKDFDIIIVGQLYEYEIAFPLSPLPNIGLAFRGSYQ